MEEVEEQEKKEGAKEGTEVNYEAPNADFVGE